MAKNYTFAEAVKIINEGTDLESLMDIGRRYPILLQKVTKVCVKAGEDFVELMSFMPEHLSANKVNVAMKALIDSEVADKTTDTDSGDESESESESENEVVGKITNKGDDDKDYESMTFKQLWGILGKEGRRNLPKNVKKADLIAALEARNAGGNEGEEEDDEDKTEEAGNFYEGKSAVELFKECKKRGIEVVPKKPAKFYVDLLIKDDAKFKNSKDDVEEVEEDDDWGEDEDTGTKESEKKKSDIVAKNAKVVGDKDKNKNGKASGKTNKPKPEKDENEDDDWDI